MSDIIEEIERYRAILKDYDNGNSSVCSCLYDLNHIAIDALLNAIETDDGWISFGSCCCSSHPPDRTFKAEFVIKPHGFTAKKYE
jgi:hypothetical protein